MPPDLPPPPKPPDLPPPLNPPLRGRLPPPKPPEDRGREVVEVRMVVRGREMGGVIGREVVRGGVTGREMVVRVVLRGGVGV